MEESRESSAVFTAGVLPGAPKNDFEIKFLICHLLYTAGEPVTFGQLSATFQRTATVNYFEFSALMTQLLSQGHIRETAEGSMTYVLTDYGAETARQFYKTVPPAVRDRCEEALRRQLKLGRRQKENSVRIRQTPDGYEIALEIPDIGTPLMGLTLSLPTREHCETVGRRFLNDPLYLYTRILALATGDPSTVGELDETREEDLFE